MAVDPILVEAIRSSRRTNREKVPQLENATIVSHDPTTGATTALFDGNTGPVPVMAGGDTAWAAGDRVQVRVEPEGGAYIARAVPSVISGTDPLPETPGTVEHKYVGTVEIMHGHQGGVILPFLDSLTNTPSNTFVAPESGNVLILFEATPSALGASKVLFTFQCGRPSIIGGRLVDDSVGEHPLAGVGDFRQILGFANADVEGVGQAAQRSLLLRDLAPGAVYTFEIHWGIYSAFTRGLVGANPQRAAIDGIEFAEASIIVTNLDEGTVSIYDHGAQPFWQRSPGVVLGLGGESIGGPKNVNPYYPQERVTLPMPVFSGPFGVDALFGRAVVTGSNDSKVHNVSIITGALGSSSTALAGSPREVKFTTLPAAGAFVSVGVKAYVARTDGVISQMSVSDVGLAETATINVTPGTALTALATNIFTPGVCGIWAASADGKLYGFREDTLAAINPGGTAMGGGAINCIHRVRGGTIAEALLVACTNSVLHHVDKAGAGIVGTIAPQIAGGGTASFKSVGASLDGVLCYAACSNAGLLGSDRVAYYWLPNAFGQGPAYEKFDGHFDVNPVAAFGLVDIPCLVVSAEEFVTMICSARAGAKPGSLSQFPSAYASINPTGVTSEHATLTFLEA